jgi:hypothetical protein
VVHTLLNVYFENRKKKKACRSQKTNVASSDCNLKFIMIIFSLIEINEMNDNLVNYFTAKEGIPRWFHKLRPIFFKLTVDMMVMALGETC